MKLYKMATVNEKLRDPIQVIVPGTGEFVLMTCVNPCDNCKVEQWKKEDPEEWIAYEFCAKRCKFGGTI